MTIKITKLTREEDKVLHFLRKQDLAINIKSISKATGYYYKKIENILKELIYLGLVKTRTLKYNKKSKLLYYTI